MVKLCSVEAVWSLVSIQESMLFTCNSWGYSVTQSILPAAVCTMRVLYGVKPLFSRHNLGDEMLHEDT